MNPAQVSETDRLVLRIPRLGDAERIFAAYAQDPEVTRYLTWTPRQNVQQTEVFVSR